MHLSLQVMPDGTYVKPPVAKAAYGTMVGIRSGIVIFTGRGLARAVTIATRYSVVRRQGENPKGCGSTHSTKCMLIQMKYE